MGSTTVAIYAHNVDNLLPIFVRDRSVGKTFAVNQSLFYGIPWRHLLQNDASARDNGDPALSTVPGVAQLVLRTS